MKSGTSATIKQDVPSITASGAASNAPTNNSTVFVDVENNKTWTGYQNVSGKTGADVEVVLNSDGVAEIVFIHGNFTSEASDDDFVILKGTGYQAEKDSNNKTVYRFTDAYDVNGEQLDNVYTANKTLADGAKKGLYLINSRDGDDYIQTWSSKFSLVGNAGTAAANYATVAKDGVLSLKNGITFGGSSKQNFAYNNDTIFVVVELKANGDVDTLRVGDVGEITTWDTASGADNTDVTGVYVMTVGNDYDDAPLAETVLVVMPDDSGITGGGGTTTGAIAGATEVSTKGMVTEGNYATTVADQQDYIKNVLSDGLYVFDDVTFAGLGVNGSGTPIGGNVPTAADFAEGDVVTFKYSVSAANASQDATLYILDSNGSPVYKETANSVSVGGHYFVVIVTDQNDLIGSGKQWENAGSYSLKYNPLTAGSYTYKITCGDQTIEGKFTIE